MADNSETRMPDLTDIEAVTRFLLDCDFQSDDFDPDGDEIHDILASKVCEAYPWREIYDSWTRYLMGNCPDAESVINWENLFWYYGGMRFPVIDPYPLLGYLLYRTATPEWHMVDEDAMMILDSIAMDMLEAIGDVTIDTIDYYGANNDPKVQAVAIKWREELGPARLF